MERERDWQNSVCIKLQHTHPFGTPYFISEKGLTIRVTKYKKIRQIRSYRGVQSPIPRDASAPCAIDQSLADIRANASGGTSMMCHNCRRRIEVFAIRQVIQE